MYRAGRGPDPDALALVARVELARGGEIRTVKGLKPWVLRNLQVDEALLDAQVACGRITLQPCRVGRYEALQVTRAGCAPSAGRPARPTTRALALPGGDYVLIVAHVSFDRMDAAAETDWEYMVSSLHVDPAGTLAQESFLYGGLTLAGLLLVVLLMRRLGAGRRASLPEGPWAARSPVSDGWAQTLEVSRLSLSPEDIAPPQPVEPPPWERPDAQPAQPAQTPVPVPVGGEEAEEPGGGLIPTLPASGRWSS